MPRVGDRVFPYTPEGEHAARLYAKRMGLHVEHEDSAETAYSPFLSRRNPVMPEMKIEGTREHFVGRTDDDDRAKSGRWGHADETKQQHFARRWARDPVSDEDRADFADTVQKTKRIRKLIDERGEPSGSRAHDDDKYGRWGYADETKRQHFDRMWDRDWDEDWRGRQWHPRSQKAGRR